MPKYYCDYCDTFLTHDSPSVRKTHNGGRKHKENVRMFYQKWMEDQAQKLVDATARAFVTGQPRAGVGIAPRPVPMIGRALMPPGAMGQVARPPVGFPGAPQFPSAVPFVPPVGVAGPMGMRPAAAPAPFRPPGSIPPRY